MLEFFSHIVINYSGIFFWVFMFFACRECFRYVIKAYGLSRASSGFVRVLNSLISLIFLFTMLAALYFGFLMPAFYPFHFLL